MSIEKTKEEDSEEFGLTQIQLKDTMTGRRIVSLILERR